MITEKPSQPLTPLSEERADSPAQAYSQQVEAPSMRMQRWWHHWAEVANAMAVWVASVGMLVFVPIVVALPYIIYRIAVGGPISPEGLQSDKILLFLSVLGVIPAHLLTIVIAWMVISQGARSSFWNAVGFEWPKNTSPVITGGLSFLLALILLAVAYLMTNFFGGGKTQLDLLIESSMPTRFATAFVAFATAPLVEEVIYRGVLYPAVEKAAGVGVAITAVSLLFAGVHVFQYSNNITVITVITLLSITLTVARAVTGKLLPSFIIHLVFNGIQSIILVLAPFLEKPTG